MGGGRWLTPAPPPPPLDAPSPAIESKAEKKEEAATKATRDKDEHKHHHQFFREAEFVSMYNCTRIVREELAWETARVQSRPWSVQPDHSDYRRCATIHTSSPL